MATGPISPELRRSGLLGRFPHPTEGEYQDWLVAQIRPVATVGAVVAALINVVNPFTYTLVGIAGPNIEVLFLTCWAVSIPILAALVANVWRPRPWRPMAMIALGIVVLAVANLVGTGEGLLHAEAGWFTGITLSYCMVTAFLLLPFRAAFIASCLITAAGVASSVRYADGPPERIFAGPLVATLPLTLVLLPMVAWVGERVLRGRFVDERTIASQQALLNAQHQQLVGTQALMRRYAPPTVADRIEHGDTTVDSAQRLRVTVLFADVVGFTSLADRLDPEALAEIMNEYLGSVARIIENHRGTLNEFAGDGVMAIFGAPDELEPRDQVLFALGAASELQRSLPEWSQRWYSLGIDRDLEARIGINTGVVSVGTFGSAVRATYTGIGLQTNIAARIQAQCPAGSVLMSKTSWHLVSDTVLCEPRGVVEVKGVHFPIAMYEPASTESLPDQ